MASEIFVEKTNLFFFFFFSSRRRHTRSYGDWSSDVCSSDLGKNIIHLQKDRFQKSDEEEENKQPIEAGLTDQPPEKMRCVDGSLPHGISDAFPKTRRSPVIARRFFDHPASIVRFYSSANEINHWKQHDLECEADHEQLLV